LVWTSKWRRHGSERGEVRGTCSPFPWLWRLSNGRCGRGSERENPWHVGNCTQCTDAREVQESEQGTQRSASVGMGSSHVFSNSAQERASDEMPGILCTGSWTQCYTVRTRARCGRASDGRNAPYGMYKPLSFSNSPHWQVLTVSRGAGMTKAYTYRTERFARR